MSTPTLVTLSTGHQLAPDAAASYRRMSALYGRPLPITSAWRSSARQAELRAAWERGDPGAAFALPAGQSKHERGLAIDFGSAAYTWLDRNAPAHGWARTNPDERWHREYVAARDQYRTTPSTTPSATQSTTTPQEDDPMRHLLQIDPSTDGRWYLVDFGAGTAQRLHGGLQLDLIRRDSRVDLVVGGQPRIVLTGLKIMGE